MNNNTRKVNTIKALDRLAYEAKKNATTHADRIKAESYMAQAERLRKEIGFYK
jgi:hypothetical protein